MKAVINRKRYDTEASMLLGQNDKGRQLYKTPNGAYFLTGGNEPLPAPDGVIRIRKADAPPMPPLYPLTLKEAIEWCEFYQLIDVLENEFGNEIEDA